MFRMAYQSTAAIYSSVAGRKLSRVEFSTVAAEYISPLIFGMKGLREKFYLFC